jgi:Mrp family chromosome partitioning ATPase
MEEGEKSYPIPTEEEKNVFPESSIVQNPPIKIIDHQAISGNTFIPVETVSSQLPEKPKAVEKSKNTLVVSLLGPTASGKSTLIVQLQAKLAELNLTSALIKKDEALRFLASERFNGKEWIGYTPLRLMGRNGFSESDVNGEINKRLRDLIGTVDVVFLEGGTRTPKDMQVTLKDIPNKCLILEMDIAKRELLQRIKMRRTQKGRTDDTLPLMALKLFGQFTRPLLAKRHSDDQNKIRINANLSPQELVDQSLPVILKTINPGHQ